MGSALGGRQNKATTNDYKIIVGMPADNHAIFKTILPVKNTMQDALSSVIANRT